MNRCYLSLGSNLNNPQKQLREAILRLQHTADIQVTQIAPFYKNIAWGRKVQPYFYNTVLQIVTRLPPHLLLKVCQAIEKAQGRQRKLKWGARSLDIDILWYGGLNINTPTLTIPHPAMKKRDFVLLPLLALHGYNFY